MRLIILLLLLALLVSNVKAQSGKGNDELPLAAKMAIQEFERTVRQAQVKAIDKLKAVMKAEIQAGKLDRVNRINQEVEKVTAVLGALSAKEPLGQIPGEWRAATGVVFEFEKDGTLKCGNGWSGTWLLEKKRILVVLDTLHGVKQKVKNQYYYECPCVKKSEDGECWQMTAQSGYENVNLIK